MKRIIFVALIISFVSVGAFPRTKSVKTTAKKAEAKQAVAAPVPLSSLFPEAESKEVVSANGMVSIEAPNHEVVMVRIEADGTRTRACVNEEAKARAFLAGQKSPSASAKKEK